MLNGEAKRVQKCGFSPIWVVITVCFRLKM